MGEVNSDGFSGLEEAHLGWPTCGVSPLSDQCGTVPLVKGSCCLQLIHVEV